MATKNIRVNCPECGAFLMNVNIGISSYLTTVKVCSKCNAGIRIEYGNGRIEVSKG